MDKATLSVGGLVIVVAIFLFGLIYFIVETVNRRDSENRETLWGPASCLVVDTRSDELVVNCDGKKHIVTNQGVILRYILNPGSLTCNVTRGGWAECEQRPFKPASNEAE